MKINKLFTIRKVRQPSFHKLFLKTSIEKVLINCKCKSLENNCKNVSCIIGSTLQETILVVEDLQCIIHRITFAQYFYSAFNTPLRQY